MPGGDSLFPCLPFSLSVVVTEDAWLPKKTVVQAKSSIKKAALRAAF
jgi:hypothetical protein